MLFLAFSMAVAACSPPFKEQSCVAHPCPHLLHVALEFSVVFEKVRFLLLRASVGILKNRHTWTEQTEVLSTMPSRQVSFPARQHISEPCQDATATNICCQEAKVINTEVVLLRHEPRQNRASSQCNQDIIPLFSPLANSLQSHRCPQV